MKWMIILCSSIMGWVGWWIGERLSSDPSLATLLMCAGTVFGVYVGWKISLSMTS